MVGWMCPRCGRTFSPTIPECPYCRQKSVNAAETGTPTRICKECGQPVWICRGIHVYV